MKELKEELGVTATGDEVHVLNDGIPLSTSVATVNAHRHGPFVDELETASVSSRSSAAQSLRGRYAPLSSGESSPGNFGSAWKPSAKSVTVMVTMEVSPDEMSPASHSRTSEP